MTHYNHINRPDKKDFLEINSGEKLVEVGAYVPAKTRIENLMNAGQRLFASRIEQYDYPDGIIDPKKVLDPTRQPNYDQADAFQDSEIVMDRIDAQIQEAKSKKATPIKEDIVSDDKTEKVLDSTPDNP